MKSIKKQLKWIFFVSRRLIAVDFLGRSASTAFFAVLGIAFGVMTLITVISVMNGFQMGYIDSIMEISSYHIRAKNVQNNSDFENYISNYAPIKSFTHFYEAQALIAGYKNKQQGALLKAVPQNIRQKDSGFAKEVKMIAGSFDLQNPENIVLGYSLARNLDVSVGDTVNLLAVSGGSDTELFSANRLCTVTGIFSCGYEEINAAFAFVPISEAQRLFGAHTQLIYGIKLTHNSNDSRVIAKLSSVFFNAEFESWRSYNRSFFGALRIEKNILLMLVFLIFVVAGVNIYNGMRRNVYERREEISMFSALGANRSSIQWIFMMQGLLMGFCGALAGLLLGLLLCINIDVIFALFARLVYGTQNSIYYYYARIPARMVFSEIVSITLFGLLSSFAAAWFASAKILKIPVAEVLRDE